ncbi:MAG: hypothetical protein PHP50_09615 [Lachnospiraceae bacterium]|nr:hypothetical protein [Lachnospiraceae bacterium]
MIYPTFNDVTRYREMTSSFNGYNRKVSCAEGEFSDMKNMTSAYYPVLSPRDKRGLVKKFVNPLAILDKETLMWIDGDTLYKDGNAVELSAGVRIDISEGMLPKNMTKMGAFVVIMPDKIWYNADTGESGLLESSYVLPADTPLTFALCDSKGDIITWHDSEYYEKNDPKEGDYMMSTSNGKSSLKQYSSTTRIWATVATAYMQITATGIGKNFKKGDGVSLTIDTTGIEWADAGNIFVNDEGNGVLSTNTVITDLSDDAITIVAILSENHVFQDITFKVERKVPDMSFITEYNNRIWGCSKDGHEIYCCKLGDVTNWNCFAGVSTDSYAVTIGSDGKFTGAITYAGYPIFFKEDSLIKVAVSSTGAHQTKESMCRGVQSGSEKSLCILNELLYYKSATCVCVYNGSVPVSISDNLGEVRYYKAAAGTINDRYYISMCDESNEYHLFVYDSTKGLWSREDNTQATYFCKYEDDLLFIDAGDKFMKSVRGTLIYDDSTKEKDFDWNVVSGKIGYTLPDQKYISRINLRISLEIGANVDFYLGYDSSGVWEHKFNMSGSGTRTYTVPVIPRRCDHFQYKIIGKGMAKIHSITKTIEQGSDT